MLPKTGKSNHWYTRVKLPSMPFEKLTSKENITMNVRKLWTTKGIYTDEHMTLLESGLIYLENARVCLSPEDITQVTVAY